MVERIAQKSAVYLLLERGDEILMLERCNTGYMDGYYSFVAGHVEAGESATNAMIREATEEAGITLLPQALSFAHVCHRASDAIYYDFFFKATEWSGQVRNMEPQKCSDLSWFSKDAVPENTIPYIRAIIELVYLHNQPFSEYNWA
ncbi:MAG: NUDIX domain-containing protein [Chloroflexota bacterium]